MGASALAIGLVTLFWALVGIGGSFLFGKGPNKGVIQSTLVITAVSCWLFWLLCYMHQMNPLIGPALQKDTFYAVKYIWDGDHSFLNHSVAAHVADHATTAATSAAGHLTTAATSAAAHLTTAATTH